MEIGPKIRHSFQNWSHQISNIENAITNANFQKTQLPLCQRDPKNTAVPLLKLIFPRKSGHPYINKMLKKQLPLVLPFTKGKQQSGFCFSKGNVQLKYVNIRLVTQFFIYHSVRLVNTILMHLTSYWTMGYWLDLFHFTMLAQPSKLTFFGMIM